MPLAKVFSCAHDLNKSRWISSDYRVAKSSEAHRIHIEKKAGIMEIEIETHPF